MVYRVISMGHPFTHQGTTVQAFTMLSSNLKDVMHLTVLVHYPNGLQGKNPNNEEEFVGGLMVTRRFDGTLKTFAVAVDAYAQSLGIGANVPATLRQGFKAKAGLVDALTRGGLVYSLVENTSINADYFNIAFSVEQSDRYKRDLLDELSERVAMSIQHLSAYSVRNKINVLNAFKIYWGQDDSIIRGLVAENLGTLADGVGDLFSRA